MPLPIVTRQNDKGGFIPNTFMSVLAVVIQWKQAPPHRSRARPPSLSDSNPWFNFQVRDLYTYDLTALRADAEHKRHTLTALRLEVSEGPTVSRHLQAYNTCIKEFVCLSACQRLDIASLQDIITTLEYDIQTLQNKVQVEKTQGQYTQISPGVVQSNWVQQYR